MEASLVYAGHLRSCDECRNATTDCLPNQSTKAGIRHLILFSNSLDAHVDLILARQHETHDVMRTTTHQAKQHQKKDHAM